VLVLDKIVNRVAARATLVALLEPTLGSYGNQISEEHPRYCEASAD
jgi:hypothetical protein